MPNFMRPGFPDLPGIDDAADSALLGGTELPPAAVGLQPVADLLASLRATPTRDELAGEARALAMFRATGGVPAQPVPAHRRTRRLAVTRLAPRAAVAAVVTIVSLGGVAVGAYAGALPSPIQRLAHDLIGAPDAPAGRLAPDPGPGMPLGPGPGRDGRLSPSPSAHPSPHGRPHPSSPGNGPPSVRPSPRVHPTPNAHPSHPSHPPHPSHPSPSAHPSHTAHPSHAPHTAQTRQPQPPQARPLPGL